MDYNMNDINKNINNSQHKLISMFNKEKNLSKIKDNIIDRKKSLSKIIESDFKSMKKSSSKKEFVKQQNQQSKSDKKKPIAIKRENSPK